MIKAILVDYYGVLAVQQKRSWVLNYQLINLLRNLKSKYKIGLLSNSYAKNVHELNPELDESLFDLVLIGGATGLWKPDVIVYETAASKLQLKLGECLVVDDSNAHLQTAKDFGIQTIFYKDLVDFQKQLKALTN